MSAGNICGDNRFELIELAKSRLIEDTNIEDGPDEMAVLDDILFRCWQMGWLDKALDGTCHLVTVIDSATDWPENQKCDQCGEYVSVIVPEVVRYCPNCGRRVVG
jgi:hypothetical protein